MALKSDKALPDSRLTNEHSPAVKAADAQKSHEQTHHSPLTTHQKVHVPNTHFGGKDHPTLAGEFNKDEEHVNWHDGALWWIRQKRDKITKQIPEWEQL